MGDIWSGLGVDISGTGNEGEWLYRSGSEVRGPVSLQVLANKLSSGELGLETMVGKEGGDFHPVTRVAAFAKYVTEAKKQAQKRQAKKRARLLLLTVVPLLAGLGVAGYFINAGYKKSKAERAAKHAAEKLARDEAALQKKRAEEESLRKMELVAIVSLGSEDSVKIHSTPAPKRPTGGKTKRPEPGETSKPEPEEMVASCKLSQADIFGTLKKSLGKINVCVEDEKGRDKEGLLPPQLELDFVVQNSGKVTDFKITDRHYRTGPLNNCMIKAFQTITFPSSNGANCPVTIPIKIAK